MFLGVGFGFRGLGFWALFHPCSKLGLSGAKTGEEGFPPHWMRTSCIISCFLEAQQLIKGKRHIEFLILNPKP